MTFHLVVCDFLSFLVSFFVSYSLVMPAVVIRQRKAFRRKNGLFIYFEGKSQTNLIFENRSSICFFQYFVAYLEDKAINSAYKH